jgi:hypothetical protein
MLKTVGFPSTRTGDQTIVNGNLVIGTAGKGIDFSATSHPAGMTSELFDDYETGTWTPSVTSATGVVTVVDNVNRGTYFKIGRMVYVYWSIGVSTDAGVATSDLTYTGLPYTPASGNFGAQFTGSNWSAGDYASGAPGQLQIFSSGQVLFSVRTVSISSRTTFYWSFAGWYFVN